MDQALVEVRGKKIAADQIRRLIVEGESLGERIVFVMDKIVNGVDLSDPAFSYEINGLNSDREASINALLKGDHPDPNKFTLTWEVGRQFTVAPYEMEIWIAATKSECDDVVTRRWMSNPAKIYIHDGFVLSDYIDITEQLLTDLRWYLCRAAEAAERAGKSEEQAKISEENAKESEINADASEKKAKRWELEARRHAIAALKSERNAKRSEGTILVNIYRAEAAASLAVQSAGNAERAAQRAGDSAQLSSLYAMDAQDSAQSAEEFCKSVLDSLEKLGVEVLLEKLIVIDPLTGSRDTVQNIINGLFRHLLATGAILPTEFDALHIDPKSFDDRKIDPYDFDTDAYNILT